VTRRLLHLWRFGVGIVVLLVVLASVDPSAVRASLVDADLRLVLAGVIGLTAVHLVPAAGWRAIHGRTTGRWLSWRGTVGLSYAAQAIGGVTPANLGGDVHRATALRRSGQDWGAAVAPLLVQRATSYLALSALAIAACAILAVRAPMAGGLSIAGAAVAIGIAGAAWLLVAPPSPLRGPRDRLLGGTPVPLHGVHGAAAIGFGTGLAFHVAAIGLTGVLVLAVDPNVPLLPVLAALAVARLALAVPITPSGLGVQEGALAMLFTALGLAAGIALAAMLLARLALLLTTVIGVALLVRSRHGADVDPSPTGRGTDDARQPGRPTTNDAPLLRG
jgi:glycosyltransferase 2 family protein